METTKCRLLCGDDRLNILINWSTSTADKYRASRFDWCVYTISKFIPNIMLFLVLNQAAQGDLSSLIVMLLLLSPKK